MRPSPMTAEVSDMISVRHSAEQRGSYEPLGRLQWLKTEHGLIYFPVLDTRIGEGCGPDLATICDTTDISKSGGLVVLGHWDGLPPLRVNSSKSCPKCRHACDVCDGSGKKLCELCGGRGWNPGPYVLCPAPGCTVATGSFKADCLTCHGRGEVAPELKCLMCFGLKQMTCKRCAGTGKYSTGRKGGSDDFEVAPKCPACEGTTYVGKWKAQKVKRFQNAQLVGEHGRVFDVIGPIREFAIRDPRTQRTRIFASEQDSAGDYLVMIVPKSKRLQQKAYLVGGIVRERRAQSGAA